MEAQRLRQPFVKVSLVNMCTFYYQFYHRLVNTVHALTKKKLLYKCVNLIANVFGKNSETTFFEGRGETK